MESTPRVEYQFGLWKIRVRVFSSPHYWIFAISQRLFIREHVAPLAMRCAR